uniref:Secreted protein n=1 Tax=Anopheles merus TaxID=30066 RepID=A0A9I3MJE4_ANOME
MLAMKLSVLFVITIVVNLSVAHHGRKHGDIDDSDGDRDWDKGSSYWNGQATTTTTRVAAVSTITPLPGFTVNRNTTVTIPPFPLNTSFDVRTG